MLSIDWNVPRIDLSIITHNRPLSLARLLTSVNHARFFGDRVSLRINIEQTADDETLRIADAFNWEHGQTFLHHRVVLGGLLPAVAESWYPDSNHSYGVLLEDDVELSPMFYAWLKMTLLRYRFVLFAHSRHID